MADGLGVAHRAVMRVVKQEEEAAAASPCCTDAGHERGLRPFMDNDEIRAIKRSVEIELRVHDRDAEFGIMPLPGIRRCSTMFLHQTGTAP